MLKTSYLICIHLFWPLLALTQPDRKDPTWREISQSKKGTITAYWHESRPFIFQTAGGKMAGIEYDILQHFIEFLQKEKGVDLTIEWKRADSFHHTYSIISENSVQGTFGCSAFSITDKRRGEVNFSPAYMSDISVLITSDNVPVMKDVGELNSWLPRLDAITIRETTYEDEILRLRSQGIPFNIQYIPSSENIMRTIADRDNAFGFIDLPVYMMLFHENPSVKVKRQNIFPIEREGYAILLPNESDWSEPIAAYFSSKSFHQDLEQIISKYIDLDLYHFVEGLAVQPHDEVVMLLTKEKEIQYKNLLGKTEEVLLETRKRNVFVILMSITLVFLIITVVQYNKSTRQKEQIESQQKNIEFKSQQLEQRNLHLQTLDEEKNNLIKILAHDLRSPINQIQGLAQLVMMNRTNLQDEQVMLVSQITDTSVRLNKMISHLLDVDALENNRVQVLTEKINITQIVEKVVKSFENQARSKQIPLSFSSTCPGDCSINGDSLFMIQVLENLISNAIKFSSPGKPVHVSLTQLETSVQITVQDNGPGLTAEDLGKVFKKFQRLSARPTNGEQSIGLGLSIVKKYVELMGGTVRCESQPNKGANFIMDFPKVS